MVYVSAMAKVWCIRNERQPDAYCPERHSARSPRAVVVTLVATCLGAWLWPSAALACRCAQPPAPTAALEGAEAVFIGRVVGVRRHSDRERAIDFVVERVFKGTFDETITVLTPMSSAACGRRFEVDVSYLVYAGRLGDALHDNLCSRTTALEHAGDDIATLSGLPLEPRDPSEPQGRDIAPREGSAGSAPVKGEGEGEAEAETAQPVGGEPPASTAHEGMPIRHDVAPALDEREAKLVSESPRIDDGQRPPTTEHATPPTVSTTTPSTPAAPLETVASSEVLRGNGCANVDATSAPHFVGLALLLLGCRRRGRGERLHR